MTISYAVVVVRARQRLQPRWRARYYEYNNPNQFSSEGRAMFVCATGWPILSLGLAGGG